MSFRILSTILAALVLCAPPSPAADSYITVASTTSTENSGLFAALLPMFTQKTGIQVRVVAVGTGQAINLARNGDADVLFVHHQPSEKKFVADGFGVHRFDVMYNDFIIAGPANDPAKIRGTRVATALKKIATSRTAFASRGDDSGTHKKERSLWQLGGIDVTAASGSWYRETGSGMGATLNVASGMNAYVLSDRATWLNFGNKGNLTVLVEGDTQLFNQYGIIRVDALRHPHVKTDTAQAFIDWIRSNKGQTAINDYRINGQQAFFANAQ